MGNNIVVGGFARFVCVVSLVAPAALGQEPGQGQSQAPPEADVSGSLGIDFTSQYFFRGIQQENQGFIAQPWYEVTYGLGDTGLVDGLGLTFGSWNSLHDGPTGSQASTVWYESDFYAGLSGSLTEKLAAALVYTAYHSPNGQWATVQELTGSLSYDDSGSFFESGLQPSVVLGFEIDGSMETGAGGSEGIYLQFGIEPSFALGEVAGLDVTLAVPVTVGLSLGDYYEGPTPGNDDTYGFFDIGVAASAPLPFLPSRMGPWSATAALHYVDFGDNMTLSNGGDASEWIFSFGLSTTF